MSRDLWEVDGLINEVQAIIPLEGDLSNSRLVGQMDPDDIQTGYLDYAKSRYSEREQDLTELLVRTLERELTLRVLDSHWVQHLTNVESLRQGIGLEAYGQRDPLVSYKKEGREMFQNLLDRIQYDISHSIFHLLLSARIQTTNGKFNAVAGRSQEEGSVMTKVVGTGSDRGELVATGARKIGRNEPCFCGSGKKYKRCHAA